MRKVALEEHCMLPGFEEYWQPTMGDVSRETYERVLTRLSDFGDLRLEAMRSAGVEYAVLSLAGPGVQAEADPARAVRKASEANDLLGREIERRPGTFGGFAHLALQDPRAAANELERCVRELGFRGAMINGHTRGQYLDDPALHPFWERAEALGAPIYLHPADPVSPYPALAGHSSLKRAMWEWGVETGTHALRLVVGGTFDRFPAAKLVLGHLGETLPFLLWRFDSRAQLYGLKLKKKPSDYIRENVWVTTSGMFSREPLVCTIDALGRDRVMFSADYPFEPIDVAGTFMDQVPLDEDVRTDVAYRNAETLFGIKPR